MAIDLATATQNGLADGIDTFADGGSMEVRSGAKGDVNAAAQGTLLAVIDLQDPAFSAASSGAKTLQGVPLSGVGLADDNAGHFRILNSLDAIVLQGTITGPGGGGDAIIDNVTIAVDQVVNLNSLTYTQPAS